MVAQLTAEDLFGQALLPETIQRCVAELIAKLRATPNGDAARALIFECDVLNKLREQMMAPRLAPVHDFTRQRMRQVRAGVRL